MKLSEPERDVLGNVAEHFYTNLGFEVLNEKPWSSLTDEERKPFVEGQKWLYGYYRLAFQKGFNRGVQTSVERIKEIIKPKFPIAEGG